jgi:sugar lactone lactonase YvrE
MEQSKSICNWKKKITTVKISFLKILCLIATIYNSLIINSIGQISNIKIYNATLSLNSNCQLGEGAFWDSERKKLWFVDIENSKVLSFDPIKKQSLTFTTLGKKIGTMVPSKKEDQLILGLEDGIYQSNLTGTKIKKIANVTQLGLNQRLNDGKCDPGGRFWVGSMNTDNKSRKSNLFMLTPEGKIVSKLDSVSISNGIVWTKDKRKMFYIDTPTRQVKSFDYDNKTGMISNQKVAIQIADSLGWPDGMAIDENDNLWIGMWGGSCITIWSPERNMLLGKVNVPAKNVTSCAFGGENKKTLYITTAKQGLSSSELAEYPLSGCLFEVQTDESGPQMTYWK